MLTSLILKVTAQKKKVPCLSSSSNRASQSQYYEGWPEWSQKLCPTFLSYKTWNIYPKDLILFIDELI